MNWRRGFRRITLILSIVAAAAAAVTAGYLSHEHAKMSLFFSKGDLDSARRDACDAEAVKYLMDSWKTRRSQALNERALWKEWTGSELGQEPEGLNDPLAGESQEEREARLKGRIKRLDLLKEQGWRTAGGDRLPWTPEEVWPVRQMGRIKTLASRVRRWRSRVDNVPIREIVTAASVSFVAVWVLYLVVYPVVVWIGRGFRDSRSRGGRHSTGPESAGRDERGTRMSWNRGFRRITLVLSIVSASLFGVACAYLSYGMANKGLYWSKRSLAVARGATCDADAIDNLMTSWKTQPSPALNERALWKEWTGSELDQKPPFLNDPAVDESEEIWKARLEERIKRLDLLKEQGWRTAGGDPLPRTPEEVWSIRQLNLIKDLESRVRSGQSSVGRKAVEGAFAGALLGFAPVWILYAVAYLLVTWIARGFRDDQPGETKRPTGTAPAGGN